MNIRIEVPPEPSCSMCGATEGVLLGPLGSKTWVRCRDCGETYTIRSTLSEEDSCSPES